MSRFEGHTPAPWAVTRSKMATDGAFDYAISAEGSPVIAEAFGRDAKGGWPPAEANAVLIAAAPDLAAENEMLRELISEMAPHVRTIKGAVAINREMGRVVTGQTDAAEALADIFARAALAKEPAS